MILIMERKATYRPMPETRSPSERWHDADDQRFRRKLDAHRSAGRRDGQDIALKTLNRAAYVKRGRG